MEWWPFWYHCVLLLKLYKLVQSLPRFGAPICNIKSQFKLFDHSAIFAADDGKTEAARNDFLNQNALALSALEAYKAQTGTDFYMMKAVSMQFFAKNVETIENQKKRH